MTGLAKRFRSRETSRLALSASLLAVASLGASPALAQDEEDEVAEPEGNPIIVTGTRIQGVAPVGSSVIPLTREDFAEMGVSTTNDALRKIPQIVNFGGSNDQTGGSVIQNSSLNSFFAKSINLRGLGTASTLTLVNGHRVAPQGPSGQLFDADNIPGIALERIEVVADGGSAIYGSDAIGGVVNFITRGPEDTVEVQFRAGFADSVEEYIGAVALGQTWNSGGIFAAYEYQHRTPLEAGGRPEFYNSDLSAYGGGPNPFFANPGNVTLSGVTYGIPSGQDGTGLTLGGLTTSINRQNQWLGAYAHPSGERHSVIAKLEQDLGDRVRFTADGMFSRREFEIRAGAISTTLNVTGANPFSPCASGATDDSTALDCPDNGTISVPYSFINDLGPETSTGFEKIWAVSGSFDIELTDRWDLNIGGYISRNEGFRDTRNQVNAGSLNAAVNAPSGTDFFNPFCDGTQFDCNSDAVLDSFRAFSQLGSTFKTWGATASVNGTLFEFPGGDVKLAVGGEFHHDYLLGTGIIGNTRTPNVATIDPGQPTDKSRDVSSAYAELFVPIVGSGNASAGIEALEFNAAVRYDHYSDIGSTTNPKFGINYSPVAGVILRGSYGTSFRAPTLVDVNKFATAGFLPRSGTGAAVGLTPSDATFSYVYAVGGNEDLQPETATTWSLGVDITPVLVPNFKMSLTYYNIEYTNRVDTPGYNTPIGAALNSGAYDDLVTLNPAFFPNATLSQAEYNEYVTNYVLNNPDGLGLFGPPMPPQSYIAIVDGRRNNGGVVNTDGIDFLMDYVIETPGADFRFGAQGSYILSFETSPIPGLPLVDEVNHFGFPAQFTARAEAGVDIGNVSATLFVNHVGSREITRAYLPATAPDEYLDIASHTTFDLTLRYDFDDTGSFLTNGLSFSVSALNLFDKDPPLVVNTGGTPIRFDPSYASALGRFVSFTITKAF